MRPAAQNRHHEGLSSHSISKIISFPAPAEQLSCFFDESKK
jgi:hypothetical protein